MSADRSHVQVGEEDFYIDLLFYHLKLHSFVVIDLKTGEFKPEFAGKMNFYLGVIDDKFRHESDAMSIGLILCQDRKLQLVADICPSRAEKANWNLPIRIDAGVTFQSQMGISQRAEIEAELSRIVQPSGKCPGNRSAKASGNEKQIASGKATEKGSANVKDSEIVGDRRNLTFARKTLRPTRSPNCCDYFPRHERKKAKSISTGSNSPLARP